MCTDTSIVKMAKSVMLFGLLQLLRVRQVTCQDQTVYTEISSTASLPCGSTARQFPIDATRVYWYRGSNIANSSARILYYRFADSFVRYYNGYSSSKYTCTDDIVLSIADIDIADEDYYSCVSYGTNVDFSFITELVMLVSPSPPVLSRLTFEENKPSTLQCFIVAIKPGVGSVVFTVTVDPDFSVQSSDSDLSEGSAPDPTIGAVSVTYSVPISLDRRCNGQKAVCEVEWRDETLRVEIAPVDMRFSATIVTITQLPSGLISESTPVTFTCLTDEANPTATVMWTVDGSSRNSTSDSSVDDGVYSALKRKSVLTLTAERGLHGKKVQCVVNENKGVMAEETLNVSYVGTHQDFSFIVSPDASNPVSVGTSATFTCELDANPTPSYSIWTSHDQPWKWVDLETDTVTLSLQKQHNKVNLFCRADGSLTGYPVYSTYKSYSIKFSASSISMTKSPSGRVPEKTEVTLTCVTDEAEPTADVVWIVGANYVDSTSDSEEAGLYNAYIRRSVLKLTVERTHNSKEVQCYVSGRSEVTKTVTLDVTFPHVVEVRQQPSDVVTEGNALVLTCDASGGNPTAVLSYHWTFVPRYGEVSDDTEGTSRQLAFASVEDIHSGWYYCNTTSIGGTGRDSVEVIVHYTPKDVSSDLEKVSYASLHSSVSVNCTVRSYPVLSKSDITIIHVNSFVNPEKIEVLPFTDQVDQVLVQVTFNPVTESDFGIYRVGLNNGIGEPTVIEMYLTERGVPQAPQAVTIESVTAVSITLSWIPGRSGGVNQTFTVHSRKDGESSIDFKSRIVDHGQNSPVFCTINDLQPQTTYLVSVKAVNLYGKSIDMDDIAVMTHDIPVLEGSMTARYYSDLVVLNWSNITGQYSEINVLACSSPDQACITVHKTKVAPSYLVQEDQVADVNYYLVIYQQQEEVFRNIFKFIDKRVSQEQMGCVSPNGNNNSGSLTGLSILSFTTLGALSIMIAYMIYKQRHRIFHKEDKANTKVSESEYYNTSAGMSQTSHYKMTQAEELKPPAEYTDLKTITYEDVGPVV